MGSDNSMSPEQMRQQQEAQDERDRIKKQEDEERTKAENERIAMARSKYSSGGSIPTSKQSSLLGG